MEMIYIQTWNSIHGKLLFGTKKDVENIDEKIMIKIPEGTKSGKTFKIDNKGYVDAFGVRGNLFVNVNITIPDNISEKEKEIYKELEGLRINKDNK